ncbi:hypothetical protein WJU23_12650 [Prosthecobacter sp. SYSU 5D2]|uniref:hypothetical protein n=1 Tax=Prosthecobacter sp. SYSU 5D2 TaxID=3134134 RepID=UPI0031FE5459
MLKKPRLTRRTTNNRPQGLIHSAQGGCFVIPLGLIFGMRECRGRGMQKPSSGQIDANLLCFLLESRFRNRYHGFPPMNFHFVDAVALRRAGLSFVTMSLMLSCSSSKSVERADESVFTLSAAERKGRFSQSQNIGVVELSGARIKARPYDKAKDETEYLATGGAMLVKRVEPPILASASEILVTPEAAILSGRQAMVKDGNRLILAEGDETEFVIDGVEVKISGPHLIRDVKTGKVSLKSRAPAASVAVAPALPKKAAPGKSMAAAPAASLEAKKAPVPSPAAVAQKPVAQSKPKPKPVTLPKSEPAVDRKELLNLMREPSE